MGQSADVRRRATGDYDQNRNVNHGRRRMAFCSVAWLWQRPQGLAFGDPLARATALDPAPTAKQRASIHAIMASCGATGENRLTRGALL